VLSIDKTAALAVPGVHTVLTFEDAPDRLFSTARHEHDLMDPDDTRVLDNVMRFIGQKLAAVVADSEAAAEEGCRRPRGHYTIRSSTQTPFLTRRALADIFDLEPDKIRVFCERVGGGFGGKQEMLVEDILALAALKTGRPVKLELTREEQFIATSTRHPMRIHIKAGADATGNLTALQLDVLSNTGAYGNHAGPVMFHAVSESISVYNCPNKKVDGVAVY